MPTLTKRTVDAAIAQRLGRAADKDGALLALHRRRGRGLESCQDAGALGHEALADAAGHHAQRRVRRPEPALHGAPAVAVEDRLVHARRRGDRGEHRPLGRRHGRGAERLRGDLAAGEALSIRQQRGHLSRAEAVVGPGEGDFADGAAVGADQLPATAPEQAARRARTGRKTMRVPAMPVEAGWSDRWLGASADDRVSMRRRRNRLRWAGTSRPSAIRDGLRIRRSGQRAGVGYRFLTPRKPQEADHGRVLPLLPRGPGGRAGRIPSSRRGRADGRGQFHCPHHGRGQRTLRRVQEARRRLVRAGLTGAAS
jgi:hypothetical protein